MKNQDGDHSLMDALREAGFRVKDIEVKKGKKVVVVEKSTARRGESLGAPLLPGAAIEAE